MADSRNFKSVGVDIGKRNDPPAVVDYRRNGVTKTATVEHCTQFPLQLPYPALVASLDAMTTDADAVMVDGNGVGGVVHDYLRQAHANCWAVITTGGKNIRVNPDHKTIHIPKRQMVEGMINEIEQSRLRVERQGDWEKLLDELKLLERRLAAETVKYEAKPGKHDDMVMALAIARVAMVPGVIK